MKNVFNVQLIHPDSHDILMNTLKSQEVNMRDELFAQAKFMISDDDALTLLSTLIYNLNDHGYLTDLDTPSIGIAVD